MKLETNTGHPVDLLNPVTGRAAGHTFTFDPDTGKIDRPTMFTHVRPVPDYRYADLLADGTITSWRNGPDAGKRVSFDTRPPSIATLRWNLVNNQVETLP